MKENDADLQLLINFGSEFKYRSVTCFQDARDICSNTKIWIGTLFQIWHFPLNKSRPN